MEWPVGPKENERTRNKTEDGRAVSPMHHSTRPIIRPLQLLRRLSLILFVVSSFHPSWLATARS